MTERLQPENELVGLYGLSLALRLDKEWLRDQANAGRIPALRVGRRLLFNPEAVRCAIARLAAQSSAAADGEDVT